MTERLSALMDGEHAPEELAGALEDLRAPGAALETWRTYHLISDALRDTRVTSPGFAERVNARILDEPTVLSTARERVARPRWLPLYAAASIAAMTLVGWVAFLPQGPSGAEVAGAAPQPPAPAAPEPVRQPLTTAANDYLLAHQAFSPRNTFQGVAPYVRTVAERRR